MTEIWKDVPQYNEYYQASDMGRIRSKDRIVIRTRNTRQHCYLKRGKVLSPTIEGSNYWQVLITVPGVRRHEKVHRLVAFAFMPNPKNKRCVNHKDGNKGNNCISNLEWVTHGENLIHAHKTGLKKPQQLGKSGFLHHRSKPVLSIKDTAIMEHGSIRLCAYYIGVDPGTIKNALLNSYPCKGHRIYEL